jgi:predicted kinase
MMSLELVVLMGLQGAGKSSFFRYRFSGTHEIVSKDLMKNRKAKSVQQEKLVRQFLSANRSVVVDNTNINFKDRQDLISIASHYNAKTILYYFPLTVPESLTRNKGENRKEVPPVAIYSAAKALVEPDLSEGFDEIYLVHMESVDKFHIQRLIKG